MHTHTHRTRLLCGEGGLWLTHLPTHYLLQQLLVLQPPKLL
jgi:hypothetical protein